MKFTPPRIVLRLLWLLCLVPMALSAQNYPSRPITIVVPYGPGSGNDMIAREVAHAREVAQQLTQSGLQPPPLRSVWQKARKFV